MECAVDGGEIEHGLRLSVVIPAYNEALRIERTLDATALFLEQRSLKYEILVVDDGSRDETSLRVCNWSRTHPLKQGALKSIGYEANRGKGHAVKFGVLRAAGAHILIMDADLATPIEEIGKLEAALAAEPSRPRIAIGSRPLPGSQLLVRQPWYRELAGRAFNGVVQLAATPGISDTQCGFKLMTNACARDLFSRAVLDGFSFDVEILFLATRLGYEIAEIPVRWSHQEGAAAFKSPSAYLRQGVRMLADLVRIRWAHRTLRRVGGAVVSMPAPSHPNA